MFTDKSAAVSFIANNIPATKEKVSSDDFLFLDSLLVTSAGIDPGGTTYYRAYFAAGRFLQLHPDFLVRRQDIDGQFSESLGDPQAQIEALFKAQEAEDELLNLTVPDSTNPNVSKSAFSAGRQAWTEGTDSNTIGDLEDNIFGYL